MSRHPHHPAQSFATEGWGAPTCPYCGELFGDEETLVEHVEEWHEQKLPLSVDEKVSKP